MFTLSKSLAQFLLALLTVVLAAKALGLDASLLEPVRNLWRSCGRMGRLLTAALVAMLAFHAVSKEGLRSLPPGTPLVPDWFAALGYNPADSDGDAIPDCWERWTRTDRNAVDAALDSDGDGVDNLAEFWNQTDPLLPDTDGDGFSDYVEIAGRAIGKTWFDPLVPARYEYDDPDSNTNGVPDRWEGTGYVYGFTDANGDSLPDGLAFPEEGDGNFDIEVTVTASRSALLSWGESTNQAFVVPPCTGLVVRLRLSGNTDNEVRLAAAMPGDGSTGLWRASIDFGWPSARGQTTEGGRIILLDGTVIDCETPSVEFMGEATTEPLRGSTGGPTSISGHFLRKAVHVECHGGYCREHDVGEFYAVADYTNVAPPFVWFVDGNLVPDVPGDTLGGSLIFQYGGGDAFHTVRCVATNGPIHEFILAEDMDSISAGHCTPGSTNIEGVVGSSTHNPTNATDHLPEVSTASITPPYGPNCPPATNLNIKAGWTHDTMVLHIRNLVRIPTGDPWDDETDHCIGLVWSEGGSISLHDYLADCCKPFADKFEYAVNGEPCGGTLAFGKEPKEFHPRAIHVELRRKSDGVTLDRMWVVINAIKSERNFDDWYARNHTNLAWVATLPKPFPMLSFKTNFFNRVSVIDPEPGAPNEWNAPDSLSTYLHHDARWEMRSPANSEGHGNQACYDAAGRLNRSGISGGTADYSAGTWNNFWNHVPDDVEPYLNAVHLDGNPGDTTAMNDITRPCLYQGHNIGRYIECRPIVQP